jgi:hypothetical protein
LGEFSFPEATRLQPVKPDFMPVEYTSNVLRIVTEDLKGRPFAQVLDIGPVCGENINFIANRVKKLFVCDLYFHFSHRSRNHLPADSPWQHLNYPAESFDIIFLWDLVDRLEDREAQKLANLCMDKVKPGGVIALCILAKQAIPHVVHSFVIGTDSKVNPRPQPHLKLPLHSRENRDVIALMRPFQLVKSFIYRNGIREFLFKRD